LLLPGESRFLGHHPGGYLQRFRLGFLSVLTILASAPWLRLPVLSDNVGVDLFGSFMVACPLSDGTTVSLPPHRCPRLRLSLLCDFVSHPRGWRETAAAVLAEMHPPEIPSERH
jgi:hypothetical protein